MGNGNIKMPDGYVSGVFSIYLEYNMYFQWPS